MKIRNKIGYLKKRWHHHREQSFYKKLISKNDLCFDIGANMGTKSKLFLDLGANVVAFEPQRSCHENLLRLSSKKFTVEKCAIGNRFEQREFNLSSIPDISTFSKKFMTVYASEKCVWEEVVEIPCYPIQIFVKKYGIPKFCKIDVEGLEWEIISGIYSKIPYIEFENTHAFKEETTKSIRHLANIGYVFKIIEDGTYQFSSKDWLQESQILAEIKSFAAKNLHSNIFCKQTAG